MKMITASLLLLSSLFAYSYPTIEQIGKENEFSSTATPYEVLEELYHRGRAPDLKELPLYKDQQSFKNAYRMLINGDSFIPEILRIYGTRAVVKETKPETLKAGNRLLRISKISNTGFGGAGPLFPGLSARPETHINLGECKTSKECDFLQHQVSYSAQFEILDNALKVSWPNHPCEHNYRIFNEYLIEKTICDDWISKEVLVGYRYGWKE